MPQRRPAWSYSALNNYETCPYQYYRLKVKKDVKDTMNEAALWGNEVHKALDKYIRGTAPLKPTMKQYKALADAFKNANGTVIAEQQLCINQDHEPTDWFAKDAWCRGIIDVGVMRGKTAMFGDWKTGKRKLDNDQLMLFAALAFAHYPQLESVTTGFVWFKEKKVDKAVFHRERQHEIWQHFESKLVKLERSFEEDRWPKKPSGLCRGWCPVKDCPNYEER